jgi:hypothetical protein
MLYGLFDWLALIAFPMIGLHGGYMESRNPVRTGGERWQKSTSRRGGSTRIAAPLASLNRSQACLDFKPEQNRQGLQAVSQ